MEHIAQAYNAFQKKYGQASMWADHAIFNTLFSSSFKKIANGAELVGSGAEHESQLAQVKGFAGHWDLEEKFIMPAACQTKCMIRYVLKTEKAGNYDVMALIISYDGQKIDVIDEVYYKILDQ